jgi:hypothetical protein
LSYLSSSLLSSWAASSVETNGLEIGCTDGGGELLDAKEPIAHIIGVGGTAIEYHDSAKHVERQRYIYT